MQKRLQLIFVCVCMALCLTGCKKAVTAATEPDTVSGYRSTVLYLPTDGGYMVPVMKSIPWEEGIGKAALSQLTDTEDNRLSAARMGLVPAIPDGVDFTLRIRDDGEARVNLMGLPELESAAAESAMVTAIVDTLVEFPAISSVRILIEGEERDKLPHGTDISAAMERIGLNVEQGEIAASAENASAITLFYPNQAASLNVPVTRYTAQEPTLEVMIAALLEGPMSAGLLDCFPEGAKLISAAVENNVAVLDFSGELGALRSDPELMQAAYDALYLTACEAENVYALDILIEGERLDTSACAVPEYPNVFR